MGRSFIHSNTFSVVILCCLGLILYSNTLNSSFHFDDYLSIFSNLSIRNLANLKGIWNFWPTRFITYLSIAFNYHLEKFNVFGYHLFNLAIHLGSAILVWWFILLTFSTPVMRNRKITQQAKPIALFAGLIFIAHPIQTQGVTYIIQRATSLATLFYLASLGLYVKFRLLREQGADKGMWRFYYVSSLTLAVMSMFTKEMTITLPLAILLYEYCFLKTEKNINWKPIIPFLIILSIIPLTMFLTKSVNFPEMRMASEPKPGISPWHYLLTQFRVIVTYLRLLFLPINQNLDYDYPIAQSLWQLPILASLLFLVLILFTAIRIFSKYRLLFFSIFWFFLTLLPESSIIPIKDVIFEHRLYLPMAGYSLFLVSLTYYLFGGKSLKSMITLLFIIVTCYSILTYNRNFVWKDDLTLWNDVIRKSPKKARPYNGRGNVYQEQRRFKQAILDYSKAIELDPIYADTYNNRGYSYQNLGNFDQAISDYNKAIEFDPNLAIAYCNRGNVHQNQGQFDKAISDYNKAIEINPLYDLVYNNRGNVYADQGNLNQALSDYNKAIQVNPNFELAYTNRGMIYFNKKDFQLAISDFNKAIEINPVLAFVYYNRGLAYQNVGDLDQAISDFNKAIEIDPNYALAYYKRGIAYFLKQEYSKAWENTHKLEALGYNVDPEFLENLRKALVLP